MKKASIFVIVVAFILSIFMISFYGLSVTTDHMKAYINSIEITHVTLVKDLKHVDYYWQGKDMTRRKQVRIDTSQQSNPFGLYIEYKTSPEDVPSTDFEFAIDSGNESYVVIEDGQEVEYKYAELNRNLVTISHTCVIRVSVSAKDGSGAGDSITLMCRDYGGKLDD